MRVARRITAIIATGCTLVAMSACSSGRGSEGGYVGGDGSYTSIEPGKRQAAATLSGKDLDGHDLSTTAYAGKVIVLNVWGSWCAPCRKEAPELVKAAAAATADAQFVGIDTRDADPAPAQAFVRAFGVSYPSLYDPDGAVLLQLAGQVPPNAIPTTLVIDKQGRIAARIVGETTATTLTGIVADVAKGR